MFARVIKPFVDKEAGVIRHVGDAPFLVTVERLEEINSTPYGELARAVPEKPKRRPKKG